MTLSFYQDMIVVPSHLAIKTAPDLKSLRLLGFKIKIGCASTSAPVGYDSPLIQINALLSLYIFVQ